jgi:hypothetical protein
MIIDYVYNAFEGSLFSRHSYITTTGMAAVKKCPVPHFGVVIFFWSFGITEFSTLEC